MAKMMVRLRLDPEQASPAEVCRLLGLERDEIDAGFGVVGISPAEHLSTILVDESTAARVRGAEPVQGSPPTRGSSRSERLVEAPRPCG